MPAKVPWPTVTPQTSSADNGLSNGANIKKMDAFIKSDFTSHMRRE